MHADHFFLHGEVLSQASHAQPVSFLQNITLGVSFEKSVAICRIACEDFVHERVNGGLMCGENEGLKVIQSFDGLNLMLSQLVGQLVHA